MAYKFQLGAARLGGAITSSVGILSDGVVSGSVVDSQGDLSGSSLELDNNGQLTFGSNRFVKPTGTGNNDLIISSNGSLILGKGTAETMRIDDALVEMVDNKPLHFGDPATLDNRIQRGSQDNGAALEFIASGSAVMEMWDAKVQAKREFEAQNGISVEQHQSIKLSGSNDFTIGATSATNLKIGANNSKTIEISGSNGVTIKGDLTVEGTTTTVNSTELTVDDVKITLAQGAGTLADGQGFEIDNNLASFVVGGNSQDSFVSSLILSASGLATDEWEISSTHISGNLPVSASAFYGDGSNLTGVSSDTATSIRFPGHSAIVTSNGSISNELTLVNSSAGAVTLTMPNITPEDLGKMFIIKDVEGSGSATDFIQINSSSAGNPLDGEDSIKIESGYGAVSLMAASGAQGYGYIIF